MEEREIKNGTLYECYIHYMRVIDCEISCLSTRLLDSSFDFKLGAKLQIELLQAKKQIIIDEMNKLK